MILLVYQIDFSISIVCGIIFLILIDYYKKGLTSYMSDIAKVIGIRIRSYRLSIGLSQERLAEISGVHPTYIGQLERGEKNATLESIEKIAHALNVPLSVLFEHLGDKTYECKRNIPQECYDLILSQKPENQEHILNVLTEIINM